MLCTDNWMVFIIKFMFIFAILCIGNNLWVFNDDALWDWSYVYSSQNT